MITTNQTLLLVLLGALCLSTVNAASTLRYSYYFNSGFLYRFTHPDLISPYYPMWDLGILQAGWTIRVSITLPNGASTSTITLSDVLLYYLDNSNQYVLAVNSKGAYVFSNPPSGFTSITATYTIYFPPGYSGTTSNFQLGFSASATNAGSLAGTTFAYMSIQVDYFNGTGYSVGSTNPAQTLLKVTETSRQDVLKVIYVAPNSPAFQFAFYPFTTDSATNPTTAVGDFNMNLYSITLTGTDTSLTGNDWTLSTVSTVTNSDTASTSSKPFSLTDTLEQLDKTGNTFSFNGDVAHWGFTLPTGFYLLEHYYIVATSTIIATPWFTFQTDSYACPYNPDFVDYYENFQGCTVSSATQGVPCAAFDQINKVCTACISGYVL